MTELGRILTGLCCSACFAQDTLWLDLDAGLVECRACGQGARITHDGEDM